MKTKMPLSQDELRTYAAKDQKKSVKEQYDDPAMSGFKKQQVDRLLQDRNRAETDPRFVYKLASIKLVQKATKHNTRQTTAMQIFLKRVYSPGNDPSLALGPPKSFGATTFDSRISTFGLADSNERQHSAGSRPWSFHEASIYPAPYVCISPLEVHVSLVLVLFESAGCVSEGLHVQYISYRWTFHQKGEADIIVSHRCHHILDVLLNGTTGWPPFPPYTMVNRQRGTTP